MFHAVVVGSCSKAGQQSRWLPTVYWLDAVEQQPGRDLACLPLWSAVMHKHWAENPETFRQTLAIVISQHMPLVSQCHSGQKCKFACVPIELTATSLTLKQSASAKLTLDPQAAPVDPSTPTAWTHSPQPFSASLPDPSMSKPKSQSLRSNFRPLKFLKSSPTHSSIPSSLPPSPTFQEELHLRNSRRQSQ